MRKDFRFIVSGVVLYAKFPEWLFSDQSYYTFEVISGKWISYSAKLTKFCIVLSASDMDKEKMNIKNY